MIFIRFNAGSLGHFLGSVLTNQISNLSNIDYGANIGNCFHTGAYNENDFDLIKKQLKSNTFKVCTHNNPIFDDLLEKFRTNENKFIFIDVDSNFVEYRLNYIIKLPKYNDLLNSSAKDRFPSYNFPIICDEAIRILRLHQKLDHQINLRPNDLIYKFGFFYSKDKMLWEGSLNELLKELNITNIDISPWFNSFQITQYQIINRAEKIYDCINKKKYINGLTDNEKGMIVGYMAQQQQIDDVRIIAKIHEQLEATYE